MKPNAARRTPHSVGLLLFLVGAAQAEPTIWCSQPAYESSHALAWDRFDARYPELIEAGDWQALDQRIAAAFNNLSVQKNWHSAPTRQLAAAIDEYLLTRRQASEPWKAISADGSELDYPDIDLTLDCAVFSSNEELQALAYVADALYHAGMIGLPAAMQLATEQIRVTYATHRDRLFNGLPMWPWEMWLNGLSIDEKSKVPESASMTQYTFLRPTLSPALRFDGTADSQLDAGLIVEPIGLVRYLNANFTSWIGVAPIVAITNDNGTGYGALVRYKKFEFGAAYHERSDDTMLYVSIDLYEWVMGKETRSADADEFLQNLRKQLEGRTADTAVQPSN